MRSSWRLTIVAAQRERCLWIPAQAAGLACWGRSRDSVDAPERCIAPLLHGIDKSQLPGGQTYVVAESAVGGDAQPRRPLGKTTARSYFFRLISPLSDVVNNVGEGAPLPAFPPYRKDVPLVAKPWVALSATSRGSRPHRRN